MQHTLDAHTQYGEITIAMTDRSRRPRGAERRNTLLPSASFFRIVVRSAWRCRCIGVVENGGVEARLLLELHGDHRLWHTDECHLAIFRKAGIVFYLPSWLLGRFLWRLGSWRLGSWHGWR